MGPRKHSSPVPSCYQHQGPRLDIQQSHPIYLNHEYHNHPLTPPLQTIPSPIQELPILAQLLRILIQRRQHRHLSTRYRLVDTATTARVSTLAVETQPILGASAKWG